jgi:predicted enzyme related to lactoylglutathione lyase
MSGSSEPEAGAVGWLDLTVESAEEVRNFYQAVVGWTSEPVDMGGYSDFTMKTPGSGSPVGGVCHARGANAGLPAQWLIYIVVEDIDRSIDRCRRRGGEVLVEPRTMEGARYCVIRDPAGAVAALYQAG